MGKTEKAYVYKTVCKVNDKYYFGSSFDRGEKRNNEYLGSSQELRLDRKRYGDENFTKTILKTFEGPTARQDAYDYEASLQTDEVIKDPQSYNKIRQNMHYNPKKQHNINNINNRMKPSLSCSTGISMAFSDVSPDIRVTVPYFKEPVVRNESIPVPCGDSNSFPNELLELIQQSVSAQSILTGTKQIISNYDIVQNFHLPCDPFINNDHQTLVDLITNLTHDYLVFGAFAIQVSWNKLNQLSELIHIPFEMVRLNVTKDKIFFNRFWSRYSTNSVVYNRFSLNRNEDEFSQIYVYTNNGYRSTYGMSLFSGVLNDLASEVSASQYIKNSLDSGLASRFIIDLPNSANLDDDQKADIEQAIKDKFCGSANSGSFMMYFNNSNDELKITQIADDNSHERFKAIADYTRQNIFMALHATPNLFGSPTATTGFSSQEYQDAYNLFYKMTVAPCLNTIAEALNVIFNMDKAIEYITESKVQDDLINEDDETIEKNNSKIKPLA